MFGTLYALLFKFPWLSFINMVNKLIDAWNAAMERRVLEAAIQKGKDVKELEIRKNEKAVRDKLDDTATDGSLLHDDDAFGPNRKTRRN